MRSDLWSRLWCAASSVTTAESFSFGPRRRSALRQLAMRTRSRGAGKATSPADGRSGGRCLGRSIEVAIVKHDRVLRPSLTNWPASDAISRLRRAILGPEEHSSGRPSRDLHQTRQSSLRLQRSNDQPQARSSTADHLGEHATPRCAGWGRALVTGLDDAAWEIRLDQWPTCRATRPTVWRSLTEPWVLHSLPGSRKELGAMVADQAAAASWPMGPCALRLRRDCCGGGGRLESRRRPRLRRRPPAGCRHMG